VDVPHIRRPLQHEEEPAVRLPVDGREQSHYRTTAKVAGCSSLYRIHVHEAEKLVNRRRRRAVSRTIWVCRRPVHYMLRDRPRRIYCTGGEKTRLTKRTGPWQKLFSGERRVLMRREGIPSTTGMPRPFAARDQTFAASAVARRCGAGAEPAVHYAFYEFADASPWQKALIGSEKHQAGIDDLD